MHFVMSYDLKAEGTRRADLEDKIEAILSPYQHVKRLSAFYVIKINSEKEWEELRLALNSFASDISEEFHYIMTSPNKEPGKYNGILYRGDWDEINAITVNN